MSNCTNDDQLCPIVRGDTVPFVFEFFGIDDSPFDLTKMDLHFTMKRDPKQEVPDLHHVLHFEDMSVAEVDPETHRPDHFDDTQQFSKIAYVDPADNKRKFKFDFQTGKGSMKILPVETRKLRPGQCYAYSFRLIGGPEDIYTVGSGKIEVEQDVSGTQDPDDNHPNFPGASGGVLMP